jgi:hypothetical protein
MFGQVSALNLFKTILSDQKSFPKDKPYKDLVALVTYILRQFFKAVEEDSFVLIEVRFTSPPLGFSGDTSECHVHRRSSRRTETDGKDTPAGNPKQRLRARRSMRDSRRMSKSRKVSRGASSLASPWPRSRRRARAS